MFFSNNLVLPKKIKLMKRIFIIKKYEDAPGHFSYLVIKANNSVGWTNTAKTATPFLTSDEANSLLSGVVVEYPNVLFHVLELVEKA
jgi:hypothetical protein